MAGFDLSKLTGNKQPAAQPAAQPAKGTLAERIANKDKPVIVKPVINPDTRYFYSRKPGLALDVPRVGRIQFKGNYFETADKATADHLLKGYSKYVTEISKEMKEEQTTIKTDQQESK